MRKIKINIPYLTLKQAVTNNGDIEIILDLDLNKDENIPKGNEICLQSGYFKSWKDDKNFNTRFCLIENIRAAFINGDYYALSDAVYRALASLYEQPGHQLHYAEFMKRYSGLSGSMTDASKAAGSAIRHANNFFQKAGIPIRLVRKNCLITCMIKKKENE